MTFRPAALDVLEMTAREAGAAETRFREEFAREILRLETERRRAYRRMNFLAALVAADARSSSREESRGAQRRAAAAEFDWEELDQPRAAALDELEPLSDAVHDERLLEETEDAAEGHDRAAALLMALADFEARFETARGQSFVVAFDRYMPETPLVDF
ncbi:hypothetical protein [Chenggangzhangella methanolivorans]|uniref:Uncharacterized protein n=1 Tax=Chenggangzhangella methanolivorans TaxID=1437009 RepID=A0A9E6R9H5_9HYPH|nr:hypothetical protein [Chenggangzhangella methanolivorans]QZO00012.1 hypothetical protein K6K41_26065 [Chenggangzhangella methanolivorans]